MAGMHSVESLRGEDREGDRDGASMGERRMLPDLRLVVGADTSRESVAHPCVNPEHHDMHPSMQVYRDHLHCFACDYHLAGEAALLALTDAPDLATALERTRNAPRASAGDAGGGRTDRATWRDLRAEPLRAGYAALYHAHLIGPMGHRLVWFEERGLTRATVDAAQLGYNLNRFVLPVWDRDGKTLLTLRYRLDPATASADAVSRSKYAGVQGRNVPLLYGSWWHARRWPERLVLCEGELDALRLHQEGAPAIALTNGAGQLSKAVDLLCEVFPRRRPTELLIASDMDEAGEKAAMAVAQRAAEHMPTTRVQRLWWDRATYGKDVTEYLQAGGDMGLFMGAFEAEEEAS